MNNLKDLKQSSNFKLLWKFKSNYFNSKITKKLIVKLKESAILEQEELWKLQTINYMMKSSKKNNKKIKKNPKKKKKNRK